MNTGAVPCGVVVVTDRRQARCDLVDVVAAAVAGGARWVLLREKDLPGDARAALAQQLRAVLAPVGGRLVAAGGDPLGGDAVHLAAADPPAVDPYAGEVPGCGMSSLLVGRSCHRAAELDRLTTEDYVTVSPVFASESKPGYGPPLGPVGLAELAARAGRPVLALGGIATGAHAAACRAAGVAGVAVMGTVMRADDPGRTVAALGTALAKEEECSSSGTGHW